MVVSDAASGGGDTFLLPSTSTPDFFKKTVQESRNQTVDKHSIKQEVMPLVHYNSPPRVDITLKTEDDNIYNEEEEEGEEEAEQLPKAMECLNDSGAAPFLKKTYEMVEDSETDIMISWSEKGESFVVWDAHQFSLLLLPKYFKHSNFSSFIRQLNTYGFKKIDPDRWEFANEGFQSGKKHLLKNIKRRSRFNSRHQQVSINAKLGLEAELENLKKDQNLLSCEIIKLRKQQRDSGNRLNIVQQRIRSAECKQLQMFIFLAKASRNCGFIQNLMKERKKQKELQGSEFIKKRRLLENRTETRVERSSSDAVDASQSVSCRNQAQKQLATMQTELVETLKDDEHTNTMPKPFEAHLGDEYCGQSDQESVYQLMSENLLVDNAVSDNSVDENLNVNDSRFYLELENLIGKPTSWSSGLVTRELIENASCI